MAGAAPRISHNRRKTSGLLARTVGATLPCLSSGREFRHLHHSLQSTLGGLKKRRNNATVRTCFHDSRFNYLAFYLFHLHPCHNIAVLREPAPSQPSAMS